MNWNKTIPEGQIFRLIFSHSWLVYSSLHFLHFKEHLFHDMWALSNLLDKINDYSIEL